MKWATGVLLLAVVIAGSAVVFFAPSVPAENLGSVAVMVVPEDGEPSYQLLSLATFSLAPLPEAHILRVTEAHTDRSTHVLSDGTSITVTEAGLVRDFMNAKREPQILVASPLPPRRMTPFAVWNDGQRVAWVSPADYSLQVYERSMRGTYLPLFLGEELRADSIVFSVDGTHVVAAAIGETTTDIHLIDVPENSIEHVATLPGYISLIDGYTE
jgi:hypothetical protein